MLYARVCVWAGRGWGRGGSGGSGGSTIIQRNEKSNHLKQKNHIRNIAFENFKVSHQFTILRNRSSVVRHRVMLISGTVVRPKMIFLLKSGCQR